MDLSCEFEWQTSLDAAATAGAERRIREDLQRGRTPMRVCHDGPARVQLSAPDPQRRKAIGLVHCSCGAPLGVVTGRVDGSAMDYTPADRSMKG